AVAANKTLTLNGGTVSGGYLYGPGTISAGSGSGGATAFANCTAAPSANIVMANLGVRFVNFTNGAALDVNLSGTSSINNFDGFNNQGAGRITVRSGRLRVSNFQSTGYLSV